MMDKLNFTQAKRAALLLCGGLSAASMMAVVANPEPAVVTQPDGTKVEITLHGDEFLNYATTVEGLTVVYNHDTKAWEYADMMEGKLVSTGILAANNRPTSLPANIQPGLVPQISAEGKALKENSQRMVRNANKKIHYGQTFDYSKFRGLVILVEYQDTPFVYSNANEIFTNMICGKNYTGFQTASNGFATYTGSVRDYYYDNSDGMFDPTFDVYGPVKVAYDATDMRQANNAQKIFKAALTNIDDQIDFSKYDTDGDGLVDMVHFIVSGGNSTAADNDMWLLWPHSSTISDNFTLDGVVFDRYSCTSELYSTASNKTIDGIGTICHEFGHVLGLPDMYDVDGAGSGGSSVGPKTWSVMANGTYLNLSRTPTGYGVAERSELGFLTPEMIEAEGSYTVKDVAATNAAYRMDAGADGEYFLLEYRKKNSKWDSVIAGEGMLVWHIDKKDMTPWYNNTVNVNPENNCIELLRAQEYMYGYTLVDYTTDPFPGSANITSLTNTTDPSLKSYTDEPCKYEIKNISQNSSNDSVTFSVVKSTTTGVDALEAEASENANAEIFNLNGVKVNGNELTPGVYIKRSGEKVSKFIVK